MNQIVIAIDGFASTGKSTVAKQLAKHLGYFHIDTGAMYRAVTLYAIEHAFIGDSFFKADELIVHLNNISLTFEWNTTLGVAEICLNGKRAEDKIRTLDVSKYVSEVAAVLEVRKKLVAEQQKMSSDKNIIMDGRDIGTVVFPNATLKLFLTASAEKRATRRYEELEEKGEIVDYQGVLKNIIQRDKMDTTRKYAPLTKAEDAIVIDNSEMSAAEQFEHILALIASKLS